MLKKSRKLHLWIGLLFAPTPSFFALSGALQVFGVHEAKAGQPAPRRCSASTWRSPTSAIA